MSEDLENPESESNPNLLDHQPASPDFVSMFADEHLYHDRRYAALDRRLKAVERRGVLIPDLKDERMMLYLFGAYVIFGVVIPILADVLRETKSK